jgi:hypothetical protein
VTSTAAERHTATINAVCFVKNDKNKSAGDARERTGTRGESKVYMPASRRKRKSESTRAISNQDPEMRNVATNRQDAMKDA